MGKYSTVTETPPPYTPMIRAPVKSEVSRNVTLSAVRRLIYLNSELGLVIEIAPQLRHALSRRHVHDPAYSCWQRRKKLRNHLSRQFLEDANVPRYVTVTRMSDSQVEQRKVPLWHYLDQEPLANQIRLYYWGQFTDPGTRQQRNNQARIVVHGHARLEL